MKVVTIIVFLEMVLLAQLALAETYNCPAGQTNALEPGQTELDPIRGTTGH
jgi:hypothetical protein